MSGKLKPGTFDVVPRGLATDPRMTATTVRVVLYIRSYGDRAFPSYATIARDLCITRRTAIRAAKQAVACGYLKPIARKDPQGDATSNGWSVNFNVGGGDIGVTTPRPECHHGGDTHDTTVVTPVSPYQELLNESQLTKGIGAAGAPPARRPAAPQQQRSKISTVAAHARELTLTGSRPRTTAGREGHEHEATQEHEPRIGRPPPARGRMRFQRIPEPAPPPTAEQRAAFIASLSEGGTAEDERRARLHEYDRTGKWDPAWGPPPK